MRVVLRKPDILLYERRWFQEPTEEGPPHVPEGPGTNMSGEYSQYTTHGPLL